MWFIVWIILYMWWCDSTCIPRILCIMIYSKWSRLLCHCSSCVTTNKKLHVPRVNGGLMQTTHWLQDYKITIILSLNSNRHTFCLDSVLSVLLLDYRARHPWIWEEIQGFWRGAEGFDPAVCAAWGRYGCHHRIGPVLLPGRWTQTL